MQQVLATQSLIQSRPRTFRVWFSGKLGFGVVAKDLILYLIGTYGASAATGAVIEYAGPAIRALPIEARLTVCNMSIEFGARGGLIAPDDNTLQYLHGRPFTPRDAEWDRAVDRLARALPSDADARFDREICVDATEIAAQITWAPRPQCHSGQRPRTPIPTGNAEQRRTMQKALTYMDLRPGQLLNDVSIDVAFIGSCTNGRLSDLQTAAEVVRGRKVPKMSAPWSFQARQRSSATPRHWDWIACSEMRWREIRMFHVVATNGDVVPPGKRCISTSNRNFENRQGKASRTHLASPAMVPRLL